MFDRVIYNRNIRFHDDPYHRSNWCKVCGLYYCWHPECKEHKNDDRALHPFEPGEEEIFGKSEQEDEIDE